MVEANKAADCLLGHNLHSKSWQLCFADLASQDSALTTLTIKTRWQKTLLGRKTADLSNLCRI